MFTAYVLVTVLAAGKHLRGRERLQARPEWFLANMTRLGVPRSWLFRLGALKAAGALGLLLGIAIPMIGVQPGSASSCSSSASW